MTIPLGFQIWLWCSVFFLFGRGTAVALNGKYDFSTFIRTSIYYWLAIWGTLIGLNLP